MWRTLSVAVLLGVAACTAQKPLPPTTPPAVGQSFPDFIHQLQKTADKNGLPGKLIKQAFGNNPQPYLQVVQSQANQPEDKDPFATYFNRMVSPTRIARGRTHMATYNTYLARTHAQTGVPPHVMVALWGAESNYGSYMGNIPVIKALATLAYTDKRRPEFFQRELFAALKVAQMTGRDAHTLTGSWAGAMGQCQFMPSNWLKLAVDADGDGKIDLFGSEPDVIASIGNYLQQAGWQAGQGWRWILESHPEPLPAALELNDRGLSKPLSQARWKELGLPVPAGVPADVPLRFYRPQGAGTPAYALGPNFDVILDWNYSSFFAFSVLTLADTLKEES